MGTTVNLSGPIRGPRWGILYYFWTYRLPLFECSVCLRGCLEHRLRLCAAVTPGRYHTHVTLDLKYQHRHCLGALVTRSLNKNTTMLYFYYYINILCYTESEFGSLCSVCIVRPIILVRMKSGFLSTCDRC
jgi:hypothetical protein